MSLCLWERFSRGGNIYDIGKKGGIFAGATSLSRKKMMASGKVEVLALGRSMDSVIDGKRDWNEQRR